MYDAVIDLFFVFRHRSVRKWNELRSGSWDSISGTAWNVQYTPEEIPMGKFVVSEATRTLTVLQLKAYDHMLKFEKKAVNSGNTRTAFGWLQYACNACGVTLGVSEEEVAAMPNGTRELTWTNLDDEKTYRDMIAQVATVLCGVCQIDRAGALIVIPFSNAPVMDIPSSWRYCRRYCKFLCVHRPGEAGTDCHVWRHYGKRGRRKRMMKGHVKIELFRWAMRSMGQVRVEVFGW